MARVWKFTSDIDTDQLAPGAYMHEPVHILARHTLQTLRPEFAQSVRKGDILVTDGVLGIGSSREQAVGALRELGIAMVVAPAYSGLFFRNCFNLGLLALQVTETQCIHDGDILALSPDRQSLCLNQHTRLDCAPTPAFLWNLIDNGGLLATLRKTDGLPTGKDV